MDLPVLRHPGKHVEWSIQAPSSKKSPPPRGGGCRLTEEKPRSPVGGAESDHAAYLGRFLRSSVAKQTRDAGDGSVARKENPAEAGQGLVLESR
jgi:hypothetical protein